VGKREGVCETRLGFELFADSVASSTLVRVHAGAHVHRNGLEFVWERPCPHWKRRPGQSIYERIVSCPIRCLSLARFLPRTLARDILSEMNVVDWLEDLEAVSSPGPFNCSL
jgi:hypothetical protein